MPTLRWAGVVDTGRRRGDSVKKNKPMDEAKRQLVMQAAEKVETGSAREAAILGGIVRCAIDTGHFDEAYVKHYAPQALTWFIRDLRRFSREQVNMSQPSNAEIAAVLAKFQAAYRPPPDDAIPAAA